MVRARISLVAAVGLAFLTLAALSQAAPRRQKTPKKQPEPAAVADPVAFDRDAALTVLSAVDLAKCKTAKAPRGEGHVLVRFRPAGAAVEAVVDKGSIVGTRAAKCVAKEFKKAKVPPFSGDAVQVGKLFRFE